MRKNPVLIDQLALFSRTLSVSCHWWIQGGGGNRTLVITSPKGGSKYAHRNVYTGKEIVNTKIQNCTFVAQDHISGGIRDKKNCSTQIRQW